MNGARGTILLFGRDGQVGWELRRALAPLGDVVALARADADFAAPDRLRAAVREHTPTVVVNAAAYTAVDRAESEPEAAHAVNAQAPGALAAAAAECGALFVHFSTDYVFDGSAERPYTEDDEVGPRSVYGRTKLEGERAVREATDAYLIFRTSWVYGVRGGNFLRTMLRLFGEREEVRVVADQVGAPTSSRMIAQATAHAIIATRAAPSKTGLYHLTANGATSWHGFAAAIHRAVAARSVTARVTPIRTDEYPTAAPRPAYSVLSNDRFCATFGVGLPAWEVSLRLVLEEMAEAGSVPPA